MRKRCQAIFVVLLLWAVHAAGDNFADAEHYGLLPHIRSVSISPDGKLLAYIQRGEEGDYFVIADRQTREVVGGGDARNIKARAIDFATNRHVILFVSETDRASARFKWERTGALLYELDRGRLRALASRDRDLAFAPGNIAGIDRDRAIVYMPGFGESPRLDLFEVSLDKPAVKLRDHGSRHTVDWFVDSSGRIVAREDFHEDHGKHRIYTPSGEDWTLVFEADADVPEIRFDAMDADGRHLIFIREDGDRKRVFRLSLDDGAVVGPLHDHGRHGASALLTQGIERNFIGVRYNSLQSAVWYTDPTMQAHQVRMEAAFPNSLIERLSATDDLSTIVFHVSGNEAARDFLLFDTQAPKLEKLESAYPHIAPGQIGEVEAIRYQARDATPITAIVTWPPGIEQRAGLPMVVFPHGGPESHNSIVFDWWAQYYARAGYVVLQPNFRGSSGFGIRFRDAGHGGWGTGVMQHDVTDSVQRMIDAGYVDPDRICIAGASYGGYSALAGGAFTPGLYRCVISVNGISDLHQLLRKGKFRFGRDSWVIRYWRRSLGQTVEDKQSLRMRSPARFAESFQAPVLLLHGKDDSVVPWDQSLYMRNALNAARKPVKLIALKSEDHWMSSSQMRLDVLRATTEFLREHNPPGARAAQTP